MECATCENKEEEGAKFMKKKGSNLELTKAARVIL